MNLQEFKAWFEGFSENLDGPPDEKKWDKIKAKIAQIDGVATSYPVFIRDYWRPWYTYPYTTYCGKAADLQNPTVMNGGMTLTTTGYIQTDPSSVIPAGETVNNAVVSLDAWRASGRAEAQAVVAG